MAIQTKNLKSEIVIYLQVDKDSPFMTKEVDCVKGEGLRSLVTEGELRKLCS